MTIPKTPEGWRKLRRGWVIKHGDRYLLNLITWKPCMWSIGLPVGRAGSPNFVIRKRKSATVPQGAKEKP